MKKTLLYLLFCFSLNIYGQNIVRNPSFEQYSTCPNYFDQLSYCQFWYAFRETPDYYNTCSTFYGLAPPTCVLGFQYPHSGNAYAGFYTLFKTLSNNKEHIGSQLLSPLIIGQKYFITFYINRAGQNDAVIASNKIGVKFSTVPYSYSNPAPINNTAHFYTDTIITDTVKWKKISGSFIADSAYNYIIIGNFFDDSNTDTITYSIVGNMDCAYYYIDDVCVSTDSLYCENWVSAGEQNIKKEEITIFPNPANNKITVTLLKNETITGILITDIIGRIVFENKTGIVGNKAENDVSFLPAGTYFISVETEFNIHNIKLVIAK